MIRFDITVRGSQEVQARLRTARAKLPGEMQEVTYRWAQGVRARLKSTPYPPKRDGQRYVRTGRLASSWSARREGDRRVVIANSAGYAVYVVGDVRKEHQAWMHKGRWWLGRDVVNEARPELTRELEQTIRRVLDAA